MKRTKYERRPMQVGKEPGRMVKVIDKPATWIETRSSSPDNVVRENYLERYHHSKNNRYGL